MTSLSPDTTRTADEKEMRGMDRSEQIDALKSLLERVKAAEGADRDLDLEAYCAATGEAWEWVRPHSMLGIDKLLAKPVGDVTHWDVSGAARLYSGPSGRPDGWQGMKNVPAFTASVDAARALVKRSLPDWWVTSGLCSLSGHASIGPDYNGSAAERLKAEFPPECFDHGGFDADLGPGDGPHRECLAIIACILSAKLAALGIEAEGRDLQVSVHESPSALGGMPDPSPLPNTSSSKTGGET